MFFMIGCYPKETQLSFSQQLACPRCGRLGRVEVWMTCQVLMLFFLPVFRFGRRYTVRMACCGASCPISERLGREIERGTVTRLDPSMLDFSQSGPRMRRCPACGYQTEEDFAYCPKCGRRF